MENFVLGLFQEHLARFIVGFRKEQVNANLLNGKGEITDVALNCAALNDLLATITPFVELESVEVSRLSFNVTAWSNLKRAPILIEIGDIRATIVEPLHFLDTRSGKRKQLRQVTLAELDKLIAAGKQKLRGPYNLFDRIMDNLSIEIKSIEVSFQPRGKFKTRRSGPWTPPKIVGSMKHIRYVSVNEFGQEASPEEVWRHNRHHHSEPTSTRAFLIYKKLSMECNLSFHPYDMTTTAPPLIKQGQVEIQIALHKRLRDAAILAVQIDATLQKVEVRVDSSDIPMLAHTVAGLQYCFAKDRAFEDPLLGNNAMPKSPREQGFEAALSESQEHIELDLAVDEGTAVSIGDDTKSNESEGTNENKQGVEGAKDSVNNRDNAKVVPNAMTEVADEMSTSSDDEPAPPKPQQPTKPIASTSDRRSRPVIILPNGLVLHEKLSFSLSLHHLSVRGTYSEKEDGYVQLLVKGVIAEVMWPKVTGEKGAYAQFSTSYLSLQERHGARMRSLIAGGVQEDTYLGPMEQPKDAPMEQRGDVNFPLFEDRSIRPDPLGLRHSFPAQAFGLKTTVEYRETIDGEEEKIFVNHDVGIDGFAIVIDTEAWARTLRFLLSEEGGGFDPRWHSGDWIDELTTEMLVHPSQTFTFEDHIQPVKEIFLDEHLMISSDLFNMTARITSVSVRIPAALEQDVKSCDIIGSFDEAMLLVSSALPRTFLNGKIGKSVKQDDGVLIEFPNDQSDVFYTMEGSEDPAIRQSGSETSKAVSTFRLQLTMRGHSLKFSPVIPFCDASQPQQALMPDDITMIVCFEGEPPQSSESNKVKIALFVSTLVQKLEVNCDFDILTGAISTLHHHVSEAHGVLEALTEAGAIQSSSSGEEEPKTRKRIRSSMRGRRVLVKRQFQRSRETGGLSVAFCCQVNDFAFRFWRQNVPQASQFRPAIGDKVFASPLPVVQLVEICATDFETGLELSTDSGKRRIVLKSCLGDMSLKAVDFDKESANQKQQTSSSSEDNESKDDHGAEDRSLPEPAMVEIVLLKEGEARKRLPTISEVSNGGGVMLRLEEQLCSSRSISLACEISTGGVVDLERIDVVETLFLLVFESLLLPTGVEGFPSTSPSPILGLKFPSGSVGELFVALVAKLVSLRTVERGIVDINNAALATGNDIIQVLLRLVKRLLPKDIASAMLRVSSRNLVLSIPCTPLPGSIDSGDPCSYCLYLKEAALALAYFASLSDVDIAGIMDVLARSGKTWDDFFGDHERGLHVSLQSTQSLDIIGTRDSNVSSNRTLLPEFESLVKYRPSSLSASTGSSILSLDGTEHLRKLYVSMSSFVMRCHNSTRNIFMVLLLLRATAVPETTESRDSNTPLQKRDPEVRTETAFSNSAVSLSRGKALLQRVSTSLKGHDSKMQTTLLQKQREIDILRYVVFLKERERVAALALTACQATGWIRMGGTHQSGQRTLTTTTMWRYWAVLRKSLILVSSSPGGDLVDVISLKGASLRPLTGGRTARDVKTGFAVIESGGMTRFFIADSDAEFELWIRHIQGALTVYSTSSAKEEFELPKANGSYEVQPGGTEDHDEDEKEIEADTETNTTKAAPNDRLAMPVNSVVAQNSHGEASGVKGQRFRQKFAGTKARLGSAVQSAKQNVKSANERQRQRRFHNEDPDPLSRLSPLALRRKKGLDKVDEQNSNLISEPPLQDAERPDVKEEKVCSSSHDSDTTMSSEGRVDHGSPSTTRKALFRQKFAGTKARFGSAVQSRRQTMKTATGRQTQQQPSTAENSTEIVNLSSQNEVIASVYDETPVEGHALPEGTHLDSIPTSGEPKEAEAAEETEAAQEGSSLSGDAVGKSEEQTERSLIEISGTEAQLPETEPSLGMENVAVNDDNVSVDSFNSDGAPGRGGRLRQGVSKIGAAVISARSGRGSSQVRSPGNSSRGGIEPKGRFSLKRRFTKNTSRSNSFGLDSPESVRMKAIGVGAGAGAFSSFDEGKSHRNVQLKRMEGNWLVRIDTVSCDENRTEDSSVQVRDASEGSTLDNKDSSALSAESLSLSPSSAGQPFTQQPFRIKVISKDLSSEPSEAAGASEGVERSLSDVFLLYTVLSEAVSQMPPPPPVAESDPSRKEMGLMTSALAFELGISPLDNLRVTGDILAGLFDWVSNEKEMAKVREYQCEVLTEFVASALNCPLPQEACEALARFLNVKSNISYSLKNKFEPHYTKVDDWVRAAEKDAGKAPGFMTEEIMSLTAACEAELVRAETNRFLAQRLVSIASERRGSMPDPASSVPVAMVEPSVPASISETLHASMHNALMKVMEERDEAHAQLVTGNVLRVHELEQERKKVERLTKTLELARNDGTGGSSFFLGGDEIAALEKQRMQSFERQLMQNSDAELISLCQQLASEISEKTSAALEVIRLKELRKVEKECEVAERDALKNEIAEYKKQLAEEQAKTEDAKREADEWKKSYEDSVQSREQHPTQQDGAEERPI